MSIVGAINIFIGFQIKSKIEKVRLKNSQELSSFSSQLSLLNKKSEIKFQKYQLEQADVIKQLYSNLIDIKFTTNSLFNESSYSSPHNEFKNRLTNWVNNYWNFHTFYSKNRILLNTELINLIETDINSLNEIFSIIFKKAKAIEEFEERCFGQLEYVYNGQYDEEGKIIRQLKGLKKEMDNKENKFKFADLLTNLEKEYFNLLE